MVKQLKFPLWSKPKSSLLAICFCATFLVGCAGMSPSERGAVTGAGLGALGGALYGEKNSGHTTEGAAIGALAGAVAGSMIGQAEENEMIQQAAHEEQMRAHAQARAITMSDILTMHANGISDEIIIKSIQNRGSSVNMSAQNIIYLKEQGLSENLIQRIMDLGH